MPGPGFTHWFLDVWLPPHLRQERARAYLTESNRLEGLDRPVTVAEVAALRDLLALRSLGLESLERLVRAARPGARLRSEPGMQPRSGPGAPEGGRELLHSLAALLRRVSDNSIDPRDAQREYEVLRPFTEGNRWSARALWAWQRTWFYRQGIDGSLLVPPPADPTLQD